MTTLIGTNPDQVPVNSMLGGMAYQDPDSVSVKDLRYSGVLTGIGSSSISSSAGDISSTVHADNATGGAILILKAGNGSTSSYYSYIRIINNDSSPKTWDIGTRGNDSLHIFDGTTSRMVVSSSVDYVQFNSGNTSFFIGNGATAGGGTTDDTSFNWSLAGAVKLCRNSTLVAEIDTANNLVIKTTGALKISEGTTAQRPASPQEGMIRKNSTLGVIEGYSEGEWFSLQGGLLNVQVFTSTALSTYTPTPGTRKIIVELLGSGGGGAYRPATSAGQVAVPSPGNNGAGMVVKYNFTLTAGQTGSVAVGFGGNGGLSPGSNGSGGQSTSFSIGGYSVSVGGGLGGTYAAATSTFPVVKMSAGYTSAPSVTGFTVLKDASSGQTSLAVYSPTLLAPHLRNSPASSVDTTKGQGDTSFSSENSTASVGSPGTDGKVIIYEYS